MNITKAQLEAIASGVLNGLGESESAYQPDNLTAEERFLLAVSNELVKLLKQSIADKEGNATRSLSQSLDSSKIEKIGSSVTAPIYGESHWRYFEYGRKRGKRPPIQAIEDWITSKGIAVRKSKSESKQSVLDRRRGMAIAIANKIAAKGTIRRFGYKGSGFISDVLTPDNLNKIADTYASIVGDKLTIYATIDDAQ